MSPTVFRKGLYRFSFFSREETRMHIHVFCADGEAKFWIEPEVAFDSSRGLSQRDLNSIERIIRDNLEEIVSSWREYFGS